MNRIERRVAGAGGPRPGVAVCEPGKSNIPQRGMLGGGLLGQRMRTQNNRAVSMRTNRVISNQIPGLNNLKNQDNKITSLAKKLEEIEHHSVINISDMEKRMRLQEDKVRLMTETYSKTMASMKEYIKELKAKIKDLETPRVVAVAKKIEKTVENNVNNKITLEIQEKEAI